MVAADLFDQASLASAMRGVRGLYQVSAVFKPWARDPERETYQANVMATRNVLKAAARVERIVYVSSLGALDRSRKPITPRTGNPRRGNVYSRRRSRRSGNA